MNHISTKTANNMNKYLYILIVSLLCIATSCFSDATSVAKISAQERGTAPFRLNWSDCMIGEGHDCSWYQYSPPNDLYGDVESVIIRHRDRNSDSNSELIFKFNERGDVSSMTVIDTQWPPEPAFYTYNYTYNSSGKATKCVSIRDGITSECTYVYGPQGNLIGCKYPYTEVVSNCNIEIYEYDSKGNLVKSRCNHCDEVDSYEVTYYGGNGLKTYSLLYGPEDIPYKIYYFYNDKGQLTSEVGYDPFLTPQNKYVLSSVKHHEYDDKGYKIKTISHRYCDFNAYDNSDHIPYETVSITNYKYDSRGNLIDDGSHYTYEITYR